MKKIIVVLFILILSGCFENSGYITKSCNKKEIANSLISNITYTYKFKNDIIEEVSIIYDYSDTDVNTISSIRTSLESQNKFFDNKYEVLDSNINNYKIKYNVDMNNEEELDKFDIVNSNIKLVKNLKEKGFTCE